MNVMNQEDLELYCQVSLYLWLIVYVGVIGWLGSEENH